jgi:hypothetical protein
MEFISVSIPAPNTDMAQAEPRALQILQMYAEALMTEEGPAVGNLSDAAELLHDCETIAAVEPQVDADDRLLGFAV